VNIAPDETVKGDVVAVGGAAHVRGTVNRNVVAIDGDIHLYDGANVKGDVIAVGGTVHRESGAEVGGSKVQISAVWTERLVKRMLAEPPSRGIEVTGSNGELVEFGKSVHIKRGEEVDGDLVVLGGSADIEGKVQGDAVVFGGPLDVEGFVRGDAVSIGGPVRLRSGSTVHGDAVSIGGEVQKAPGARLGGESFSPGGPIGLFGPKFGLWPGGRHLAGVLVQKVLAWFVWGLGLLVVTLLVALVLPRQTDVIATSIAEAPGRAAVYGLVGWLLVLPVLVILAVLIVTWIVIPFYLAAVVALTIMGGVGVNVLIGRRIAGLWNWRVQSVLALAVIGCVVLHFVDLVALFPPAMILTCLISLAVLVFGFGGALMTRFGTDPTGRFLAGQRPAQPPAPTAPVQPTA
jgi:cytoskeletal protein CcmA (bactofilin family)